MTGAGRAARSTQPSHRLLALATNSALTHPEVSGDPIYLALVASDLHGLTSSYSAVADRT